MKKEKELIAKHGSMEHYYDSTPIKCKVAGPGNLYISAEGIVPFVVGLVVECTNGGIKIQK